MDQGEFDAMPPAGDLRLITCEGQVLITCANVLVYRFVAADTGMRNLAIVALTDAGRRIDEVARVFGLTATYVSILRGRAREDGSAGLVRRRGRPPKLTARQVTQARTWAGAGWTQQAIADRFAVARSVIGELLARLGPAPVQGTLPTSPEPVEPVEPAEPVEGAGVQGEVVQGGLDQEAEVEVPVQVGARSVGSARIGTGTFACRYAGAMLLHPYLHLVGAEDVFATLTGAPSRRYDDLAVLTTATLAFALGADTIEGIKHLSRAGAGAAVGLASIPELATLRTRLGALADGCDPLVVQRAFAAAMLTADPAADPVYFVDDHFVPYAGARPVAKGWNTKRRHAQPGRDDTVVVDARGRAVLFSSGEPTSLAADLPAILTQLRHVVGPGAPILLAFDRGGAYPVAFTACRDAGAHWVTYRRAPLAPATTAPKPSSSVHGAVSVTVNLADETVDLPGYGAARQLTLFERDNPVLQVLTSDTTATGAGLVCWLRARWRIENMFKYAAEHNGIDALADYLMDIGPDHRKVTNPARIAARKLVTQAQEDLITAERALPQLLATDATPAHKNAAMAGIGHRIEAATRALADAKTALRPIPAKIAATDLDPGAQLARPHLARRGLQMVLDLLAYNAEAWTAEHFNAYLIDPNEYRAILRHLLHLTGTITYTTKTITITLDRPDSPRTARALTHLTEELNTLTASLPGDPRPLTYQLSPPPISTKTTGLLQEV